MALTLSRKWAFSRTHRLCSLFRDQQLGEQMFTHPHNTSAYIHGAGGVPFYGNVYAGRVNTDAWSPPPQHGSGLLTPHNNLWDDPVIQAKIQKCPYFALCDQVLWQNMDPSYLDPGLLSVEEHQLLLLFSRAYFEKWRSIHTRPEAPAPRLRILYGQTSLTAQICQLLEVPEKVYLSLTKEYLMDDAGLIAMNPNVWETAYLEPANRDQFSGRVLEYAGLSEDQRNKFYLLLEQMRRLRIRVKREDGSVDVLVLPFSEGPTLYDLSTKLGVEPYCGRIKAYDLVDDRGTAQSLTIANEDDYFDFLVMSFYKANLQLATLTDVADDNDCTSRYSLTVELKPSREAGVGRWF